VPYNYLQEALQALSSMLNDVVRETVGKYLSRERRNGHTGRLALQDITEVFEIRVAAPDTTMAEFKGGDIGSAKNLVVCVHVAAHAVSARVPHLMGEHRQHTREHCAGTHDGGTSNVAGRRGAGIPRFRGSSREGHISPRNSAVAHLGLPAWSQFLFKLCWMIGTC
jgi:hypothetical protein